MEAIRLYYSLKGGDSITVRAHNHLTTNGNVIDDNWSRFLGFLFYPTIDLEPAVIGSFFEHFVILLSTR